jgi:hypothetical protein
VRKNEHIFNQYKKPNNFLIKPHSKKRKSHVKNRVDNSDYTFDMEDADKSQFSEKNRSQSKNRARERTLKASPYKRSKLKIKLANSSMEKLPRKDSNEALQPKYAIKKDTKRYKLDEFEVLSLLGYGTFGSVLLVKHPIESLPLALKVVKKAKLDTYKNKKQIEHVENEKQVLLKIQD